MTSQTSDDIETDLCIIGAGSSGLSVAAGASQMGARVVLLEGHKMGGDCLNYGCVPSKALIACGKAVKDAGKLAHFGVNVGTPQINFAKAMQHVHDVIASIAPHDSQERFEGFGVKVIREFGEFVDPDCVRAGNHRIRAKYFIIATGSRAATLPIAGLDTIEYLTNETIFSLRACPKSLLVIGAGPIGVELGQAFQRLGAQVHIMELSRLLSLDDQECAVVVREALHNDGVQLYEGVTLDSFEKQASGEIYCHYTQDGAAHKITATHVLVAAGRTPNIERLQLNKAQVASDGKMIRVDARLRTTNKRVFAMGDVAGQGMFTHLAGYHAKIIISNLLFRMRMRSNPCVPRVTYCDPELAHVGMDDDAMQVAFGPQNFRILRASLGENDRARASAKTQGMIKVRTTKRGIIKGVTIVGENASDLIAPWLRMVEKGEKIGAMASTIFPYPTMGEVSKVAAGSFYTASLFSDRTRAIVRHLLKWP
ncbi:MAG: FAD-dependent oxidoreductase [Pseudomonadota bacterium]